MKFVLINFKIKYIWEERSVQCFIEQLNAELYDIVYKFIKQKKLSKKVKSKLDLPVRDILFSKSMILTTMRDCFPDNKIEYSYIEENSFSTKDIIKRLKK